MEKYAKFTNFPNKQSKIVEIYLTVKNYKIDLTVHKIYQIQKRKNYKIDQIQNRHNLQNLLNWHNWQNHNLMS